MAFEEVFWMVSCWPAETVTLAGLKPESVYWSTTALDLGTLELEADGDAEADGLALVLGDGLVAGATATLRVAKKSAATAMMTAMTARVAIVERLMALDLT